ncbi:MAG: L-threonylcarbamoyladenylate synthase [Candidatus Bathyarchaeota archaeon]|nr:L-threonylcarbamoyladenylate synthase [Candidatus Bathyarchaeota archaeon]
MKVLPATEENIEKAAAIIKKGGVVVYPTETVYGIGCAPYNAEAAERVCYVKGRADKPLPLACADAEDARGIVEFNPAAERLAERFWPGPLMLVLPARIEYSVWVTHGAKTLGVRVPDHGVARRLAELSDGVIVSTSANRTGEPPATTAEEAADQIGEVVDLILDGGPAESQPPSTVLDLSGEQLWILRAGPITGEQIKNALKG